MVNSAKRVNYPTRLFAVDKHFYLNVNDVYDAFFEKNPPLDCVAL